MNAPLAPSVSEGYFWRLVFDECAPTRTTLHEIPSCLTEKEYLLPGQTFNKAVACAAGCRWECRRRCVRWGLFSAPPPDSDELDAQFAHTKHDHCRNDPGDE